MSRSHPLALVLAAALTAALAPAALASPAAPAKADHAKAEHDRIVAYWTPERMKAAKPRDFVRQKDGSFTLALTPKAKPSGGTSTPTALSFPTISGVNGAWPDDPKTATVRARTGKVYFKMGRSGYVCSGSVVGDSASDGVGTVLTAAHCAYDWRKGFATSWLFIPDFDGYPVLDTSLCSTGGSYGCWTARALVVHRGFVSARSFNTQATNYDFAFAVVGPGGKPGESRDLDQVVGAYDLTTPSSNGNMNAFGYPAAGSFNGEVLRYCASSTFEDPYSNRTTWGLPCDMTGGSSGGPWFDRGLSLVTGDGGAVGSLNSYGYSGYNYMFGPKFNTNTQALLDEASKHPSANLIYPLL
jgi:hypothetical protein